jgi:hypothetical protein
LKHRLPSVLLRSWLGALLLLALGGCSIFHPYRLPTPKPSPEYKAQQEAEAKARKEREKASASVSKSAKKNKSEDDTEEAATDVSAPSDGALAAPTASTTPETRTLPEGPTVKYDKHQMLKKPKLMRRRRHNKGSKPFRPIESIRNFFKYGLHKKPNYSPDHRPAPKQPSAAPADELPDEAMPSPAPSGKP